MSVWLRIFLIGFSLGTFGFIVRKIKKSQMQVMDCVFWILTSVIIIILSVFPGIAIILSDFLEIQSPVNFIFLAIIFILLLRCFLSSIKISQLEYKIKRLTEEIGVRENLKQKECRNNDFLG